MTEQTQPRDHGKYSFKQQSEAGLALAPERAAEKLADVISGLAVKESQWDAEEAELDGTKHDLGQRRARLAGARAASAILTELPDAATVVYHRSPVDGSTELQQVRDATGTGIFQAGDLKYPLYADAATTRRRGVIRRAVDGLSGPDREPLPEPASQGISITESGEELDIATAIDDGLEVLDADDLTPEQASAQRMDAALSHWVESPEHLQEAVRDMFTDMRHHAKKHGIDLNDAFQRSAAVFLNESNDPAFKEGF